VPLVDVPLVEVPLLGAGAGGGGAGELLTGAGCDEAPVDVVELPLWTGGELFRLAGAGAVRCGAGGAATAATGDFSAGTASVGTAGTVAS
jgi:hypothetical protein